MTTIDIKKTLAKWSVGDSLDLYNIGNWGKGYFSINEAGHVTVHPDRNPANSIDMKELVDSLQARGITLPVLLRFSGIMKHRLEEIHGAFQNAIQEMQYQGQYSCIYPIKVNQERHVVDEYLDTAAGLGFGIEAGSKPELLAVLALAPDDKMPIICNGFKDDEFIETVILAKKLGKTIIPVVEKWSELEMIVRYAREYGVRPEIGIRAKLASRGAGRWEGSAGVKSKFGLTIPEILRAFNYLKDRGMADCLSLLHFHMGSQITNIRSIKSALNEASRIYAELKKMGAGMKYLDVGGGLGIDYDGSQTNSESSVNYTLQEYANDVVFRIKTVCDEAGVPHPIILSESGRAIVGYHSVLVFNVLGKSSFDMYEVPSQIPADAPQPIKDLRDILQSIGPKNYLEHYHDASQIRDEAINAFTLGYLTLQDRSWAESLFWSIALKTSRIVREFDYKPDELEALDELLCDIYFCNFSVFQSMPDSWAIRQLFPVMPIHRLNEEPVRRGVLADITCDSDGKIDQFVDLHDIKKFLELHEYTGEKYYLGAFLIGAYQEILGDLHNLLGDTNAVHVSLDADGEINLEHVVNGDTVQEVLSYVQYDVKGLISKVRRDVERAVREKRLTIEESAVLLRFYTNGMNGYTYLEEPHAEFPGNGGGSRPSTPVPNGSH